MKLNKIKINSYGKLENREINLDDGINIIYGENEAGKSTLINFITNCFYGISKNKKGRSISDYDKYKTWGKEEFSGKIYYELDNKDKYEVYRDFNKKNPKIFDENAEEISKEFNIDKNKGNEFFYEQTKLDEELFLSTLAINQKEVILENQTQNILIQKIANLVGTGDDNVSYKKAIDRINKRQLEEIGTERSREKPINLITKKIEDLSLEKEDLIKYQNDKYNIEEKENNLKEIINDLENENNCLIELKLLEENNKIEKEKINIKENIKNENKEKINLIKNKIKNIKNNNINFEEENNKKENIKNNNKKRKKLNIILIFLILINILQFVYIKNKILNYTFLLTVPAYLSFYIFLVINQNKIEKNNKKNNLNKINLKLLELNNEERILEKNILILENEINNFKNNFNFKINSEENKIKEKYINKIKNNKINELFNLNNLEKINFKLENIQKNINNYKIELHSLKIDKENINSKLENLQKVEEELISNKNKILALQKLNNSINLAKEALEEAYTKMRNTVTPKFTDNLSSNISNITNGKYTSVKLSSEEGMIVELASGDYIPVDRLSTGTIDQLYLSLRLSMIDEICLEKVPIFLDEAFAFYDEKRLENILKYLYDNFKNRQIIIFTCTNREKNILEKNDIKHNLVIL